VYDSILSFDPAAAASATGVPSISPAVSEAIARPGKPTPSDFRAFSKRWNRASVEQKQALTMEHRRAWWEAMVQRYPATQAEQV
jgi:large subunit ribosomal protein L41